MDFTKIFETVPPPTFWKPQVFFGLGETFLPTFRDAFFKDTQF